MSCDASACDLRQAAVAIVSVLASDGERDAALSWLRSKTPSAVAKALAREQMDQLFLHHAETRRLLTFLPPELVRSLAARRLQVVGNALRQEQVLEEAGGLFDSASVPYLVFKGASLRTTLYPEPHLRPCTDVDVLVLPAQVGRALELLERQGYRSFKPPSIHEVALYRDGVCIDLHWHVMRPERMRRVWTPELIEQRVCRGGVWGPSDTHNTILSLVHPAITDYVTGRLVRGHDLDLWIRSRENVAWDDVLELLSGLGLRTAAWTMLVWTQSLFRTPAPPRVIAELAPPTWRRLYLEKWISLRPDQVYARSPSLARAGFSLALQDSARDALRAAWSTTFVPRCSPWTCPRILRAR